MTHRSRIRLAVLLGGAIGTLARAGVVALVGDGTWPWATFVVNVVGSAALGIAIGSRVRHPLADPVRFAFVGVGVLGAFTTFGGFAVQIVDRATSGRTWTAVFYLATSVVVGLTASVLAKRLGEEGR